MKENEEFKKLKSKLGITLVALVVTIVVLIILATISINIIFGEEGIVERVRQAKEETTNAQVEEEQRLAEAANTMEQHIKGERETVTITKEEYEKLKPQPISTNSIIMTSTDTDLAVAERNLTHFTNEFSDDFSDYFTYDSTTGTLTCQEDGWYLVHMQISIAYATSGASIIKLDCAVNSIDLFGVYSLVGSTGACTGDDSDASTFYFSKGDTIKFTKKIENSNIAARSQATIKIIKM